MEKFEKNTGIKGITLIALVITIIVLLILAGISINMLSGENNILKQAGRAKEMTDQSNLEEEVNLAYLEYISQVDKINDLEYYLNKITNSTVEKLAADTWYILRGKADVTVYENGEKEAGKTEIWDGTTVECPEFKDFNWYIYRPGQLKFLADFVNNANELTEQQETIISNAHYTTSDVKMDETVTVYLMNNLDLGARPSAGTTEKQRWETTANEAKKWTPIYGVYSSGKYLKGKFEGNNNTIKGVYVNSTNNFCGIFAISNTIQNLSISNSYIEGGSVTGGILGFLVSGKIENCHNKNVTVMHSTGQYVTCGGVVAQSAGDVINCSNSGNIIGTKSNTGMSQTGGIIGYLQSSIDNPLTIRECLNTGRVSGEGKRIGGIAGLTKSGSSIISCHNKGIITSSDQGTGGISGGINSSCSISECSNSGEISGNTDVGGIVGGLNHSQNKTNSTVEKCFNNGEIKGLDTVGGVVGVVGGSEGEGTIIKCYNKGKVTGTTNVGEIIGIETNNTGLNTLNKLFYLTNSRGLTAIGGEEDNETKKIKGITNDLIYDQFKTWIEEQ